MGWVVQFPRQGLAVHAEFAAREEELCRTRGGLAAADEVDDLEGVVRLEARFLPLSSGKNIEIALDGDAVSKYSDMFEECGDRETLGNFTTFAIDSDNHQEVSAKGAFARERMVNRISSLPASVRA